MLVPRWLAVVVLAAAGTLGVVGDIAREREHDRADAAEARLDSLTADIRRRCTVKRDGSMTCPPGTMRTVEHAGRGPVR